MIRRDLRLSWPPTPDSISSSIDSAVALHWGPHDQARMAELNRILAEGSRCNFCSRRLTDRALAIHPGVCRRKVCQRRARDRVLAR